MIVLALFAALAIGINGQATISSQLSNSSAVLGGNANFTCTVTGTQNVGQNHFFRKGITNPTTLSSDATAVNTTKHSITGKYTLIINNAVMSDEGAYSCSMDSNSYTAYLVVSDPPATAEFTWPNNRTWNPQGETNNLTCSSARSRPPATFRWFRGASEITTGIMKPTATVDSNGYGTSYSYMSLKPESADENVIYTCHVDVPGGMSYFKKELPIKFSGAGSVVASLGVLVLAVFSALKL